MATIISTNKHERWAKADERVWHKEIKGFFAYQWSVLNARLKEINSVYLIDEERELNSYLPTEKLTEIFNRLYREQGRKYCIDTYNSLIEIRTKADVSAWYLYRIQDYARKWTALKVTGINSVTKTIVTNSIKNSIEESNLNGLGADEMAKKLRADVASTWYNMSQYRSLLIARTETTGLRNYSSFEGALYTGLHVLKGWGAYLDNKTRPDHVHISGQPAIKLSEPFKIGGSEMMYPGDPNGSADEVVNCRCSILYETPF